MRKKDLLIILLVMAISGILYAASKAGGFATSQTPSRSSFGPSASAANQADAAAQGPTTAGQPQVTEKPIGSQKEEVHPSPEPTLAPAACYMLVTVGDVVFLPYPLLSETDLPITQAQGQTNTVHITPDGFSMISASCDNQECVHQGEVTLENRGVRLLGNQVICLPNQVTLALLNPQEAAIVWGNAYGE